MEILIPILMVATLGVVLAGFIVMAKNKPGHERLSNKLMIARVALQAGAVALIVIFALIAAGD